MTSPQPAKPEPKRFYALRSKNPNSPSYKEPASKKTGDLAIAGAMLGGIAALFTSNLTLGRMIGHVFVGALAGTAIGEHEKGRDKPPQLTYTPPPPALPAPSLEGADYVADLLTRVIHVSTESDKIIKSLPNALNTTLITLR